MTQVVYVDSTGLEAPAGVAARQRLRHRLYGWDGSVWELSDVDGPTVLMEGDVVGLDDPEVAFYLSEAPAVAGARVRGSRDLARAVYLPVMIQGDSPAEYLANRAAFRRILHPRRITTWEVLAPGGVPRRLQMRYAPDPLAYSRDPFVEAFEVAGLRFVAHAPYWQGDPVPGAWSIGEDEEDFLPTAERPESYYVSTGSTIATAELTNPGDEPAGLTWRITAGASGIAAGAEVGVGGRVLGLVPELDPGDVVVIDTATKVTTLNGARARGILSPHQFESLPPGETSVLSIAATGSGIVSASLVPLYRRGY